MNEVETEGREIMRTKTNFDINKFISDEGNILIHIVFSKTIKVE